MKVLKEEILFNCDAKTLWNIITDISRCDWVPSVNEIAIEDDCRVFEMSGMGKVREKIIMNDSQTMTLKYSAIETRTPLNHHLATMNILKVDEDNCNLIWTTEIDPEIFADAIHQGMLISIEGIKKVLSE